MNLENDSAHGCVPSGASLRTKAHNSSGEVLRRVRRTDSLRRISFSEKLGSVRGIGANFSPGSGGCQQQREKIARLSSWILRRFRSSDPPARREGPATKVPHENFSLKLGAPIPCSKLMKAGVRVCLSPRKPLVEGCSLSPA